MTDCITETSNAAVSIGVWKEGYASSMLGHNLLLAVKKFSLYANKQLHLHDPAIAELISNVPPERQKLARCCAAVAGGEFTISSISVRGSHSHLPASLALPPPPAGALASSAATRPTLFDSAFSTMGEGDCSEIVERISGLKLGGGILTRKEQSGPGAFNRIAFTRPSTADWRKFESWWKPDEAEAQPVKISGMLRILAYPRPVDCFVFLRNASDSLTTANAVAAEANKGPDSDIFVAQCPVKCSKWSVDRVDAGWGALRTRDDVLVEVAVPVNKLLDE